MDVSRQTVHDVLAVMKRILKDYDTEKESCRQALMAISTMDRAKLLMCEPDRTYWDIKTTDKRKAQCRRSVVSFMASNT